jgi:hypothetical protein
MIMILNGLLENNSAADVYLGCRSVQSWDIQLDSITVQSLMRRCFAPHKLIAPKRWIQDVAGIKFLYGPRQNVLTVPKLISPLDNTQHRVLVGTGTQAASGITFRWEQNTTLTLTNFSLQFAANSTFTQNVKKFHAAAQLAFFMGPGAKLNVLKIFRSIINRTSLLAVWPKNDAFSNQRGSKHSIRQQ